VCVCVCLIADVRTLLAKNGLSVASILGRMLDRLVTNQIKLKSVNAKLGLISKMADIEYHTAYVCVCVCATYGTARYVGFFLLTIPSCDMLDWH
jgi:cytochrome c biogenesis protein ResB